jgi:hypothetical protein
MSDSLKTKLRHDKRILFSAADGPEGLEIYTSEEEGIVDWTGALPGLYVVVVLQDVSAKFGPFQLPTIREALEAALAPKGAQ